MAGLDDAGMDGPTANLVQAARLPPAGSDRAAAFAARRCASPKRIAHAPMAVIEPGAGVGQALRRRGRTDRATVRSSRSAGGWMAPTDGKRPSGQARLTTATIGRGFIQDRHVHGGRFAPEAEQAPASPRQFAAGEFPLARHRRTTRGHGPVARPGGLACMRSISDGISRSSIRAGARHAGTRPRAAREDRSRRTAPGRDARTSAR